MAYVYRGEGRNDRLGLYQESTERLRQQKRLDPHGFPLPHNDTEGSEAEDDGEEG